MIKGNDILDLGCGYFQNYITKNKSNYINKQFTCMDNDLQLINTCHVKNKSENIVGVDIQFDEPTCSDIILDAKNKTPDELLRDILRVLRR